MRKGWQDKGAVGFNRMDEDIERWVGDRHQRTIKSHNVEKLIRNVFIKNHNGVPKRSGSFSQENSIGLATTTRKKKKKRFSRQGR